MSTRRNARLRREYLYSKSLEGRERTEYEQRKLVREALAEGRPVPTELHENAGRLARDSRHDDAMVDVEHGADGKGPAATSELDNEYAKAGRSDPKVFITTSRDPSSRLKQFAKELRFVLGGQRMNRGKHVLREIVEGCRNNDVTDIVMVHEHRGEPDGLVICHLPYGPTAYFGLSNVVTRHDVKKRSTMSLAKPHLVFENFSTRLGQRTMNVLRYLFPPAAPETKRVVSFINKDDYISFRHHTYGDTAEDIELDEVGPRFDMRLWQIRLGTMDQDDADVEFSLRQYTNTAWKRRML